MWLFLPEFKTQLQEPDCLDMNSGVVTYYLCDFEPDP